ncbi:MAG: SpoIIE family protein phosphatase, partial [Acidobacteriota bacterium]|nr:SpoIIE family protein phosphatase [Acidobacteriota bacterium]
GVAGQARMPSAPAVPGQTPRVPAVGQTPATSVTVVTSASPVPAPAEPAAPASPIPPLGDPRHFKVVQMGAGGATSPVVIDMAALRHELDKAGVKVDDWSPEIEKLVASGIGLGASAASGGMRMSAETLQRMAEERRRNANAAAAERRAARRADVEPDAAPEAMQASFVKGGEELDVTMRRDGKPVGKVNARLRLDRVLSTVVSNTRRENGEIAFAIDRKGAVVTHTTEDRALIDKLGVAKSSDTFYSGNGWLVVMRDDPAGSGARFGIARRIGDSVRDLRVAAGRDLATGLGVISLALVGIFPISGRLTRNVRKLHAGVDALAAGNYAARVDVTSKDEVGRLATAFNRMASDLEAHQKTTVEQERLKRELELCRQIQNDMLPREPFHAAFADVRGISLPAREVGGDFFNYFTMGDGDLAVLVGDVSGKGVSAALTMANVQATLKARLPVAPDLAQLVASVDTEFDKSSSRGVYATLFAAVLDRKTRTLRYVNAGHHPQFVLRVDGTIIGMPSTGLPIGLLPGHGYAQQEIALDEGDLLFFYTDGAVETENEQGDMFGAERLEELLVSAHSEGIDAVLERAESAVRAFRGAAEPFDDATMMALRVGK